jgi:hypothetical protein
VARHVEDADDVRVVQRRGGPGLAQEALQRELLLVPPAHRGQHLDRDLAVQFEVFGQVDRAHAAAAELVLHHVGPDAEPLVPAGEQLRGLELGQKPVLDERRGGLGRHLRQRVEGQQRLHPVGREEAALLDQFEELDGRSRGVGCHDRSEFRRVLGERDGAQCAPI